MLAECSFRPLADRITVRISVMLILVLPIDAFACMVGPSHSSTLTYGALKILIGILILFFSFQSHIRSNKIFQGLFCSLIAFAIVGSIYSVVFRNGLYSDPACGTDYGQQTGAFLILCLIVSLLAKSTIFVRKRMGKRNL